MKTLLVLAHPERRSFGGALLDQARSTFEALGHEVEVSDLYRLGFQPVLGPDEFAGTRLDESVFDPSAEQESAHAGGTTATDVASEQAKVEQADLVVLVFPIWWFSMPAIMKGWVDRVLSRGFAYSSGRKYSAGHFVGKRAMVVVTTGTGSGSYEPHGIDGDLHHVLWPIQNGVLAYSGFAVLPPFAAYAPAVATDEARAALLSDLDQHLRRLDDLEPMFVHPLDDYDSQLRLRDGVEARSGVQWNPSAGQTFAGAADEHTPRRTPRDGTP